MEARRKKLGKWVSRDRKAAGYRSQRAFATALGVHERSVAAVESGEEKVGETVLGLIEDMLYPRGSVEAFLATGDESALRRSEQESKTPAGQAEVERIVAMSRSELMDEADAYDKSLGEGAGDRWLDWAMDVRRRAKQIKPSGTRENAGRDAKSANSSN
ncbi:hypothetical protein [Amycolatopsis palatopharyngis]|uniref:hypothetical protein n=1 Tax=Amycolatopsis palatopharyngis TaxID=187982 RepID=UPI000E269E89|nr:hypothetical protein [Amycolatopsis palatopharyngis]